MADDFSTLPPSLSQIIQATSVFRDGGEWLGYTLYHYMDYPTTGQLSFQFFGAVQGLTLARTNLELNGQLPMHKAFIVQAIEVAFLQGALPSVGALAGGAANTAVNEAFNVLSNGYAKLNIGDKEYATIAPLSDAPSQTRFSLDGFGTDQTSPAATLQQNTALIQATGRQFKLSKPVLIPSNSTFGVDVGFDSLKTVTAAGRLGVKLRGILIRRSQ